MNEKQKEILVQLVRHHLEHFRAPLAEKEWSQINNVGWDKVSFAYYEVSKAPDLIYFRVQQSNTFVMEFDRTRKNDRNHIHLAWRDLTNEYGKRDILAEHYRHAKEEGHRH